MPRRTTKAKTASKKNTKKKVRLNVRMDNTKIFKVAAGKKAEPSAFKPRQKNNFTKKVEVDYKKIERGKRLIMWTGVIFFMVLICSVWIFNLKNVFRTNQIKNTNNSVVEEWDKMADEFGKSWEKVKQGMDELKDETTESGKDIFSEKATTTDGAIISEDDEIKELKKRLEELESKVGEEQAASTP